MEEVHASRQDPASILQSGDIVFERGDDLTSKAVAWGQRSLNLNGDQSLSHAAIVVAPRLLFEADTKTSVAFRILEVEEASSCIHLVYRPSSVDVGKLMAAVRFLYGESYSYKLIFTHLFSERQRADFDHTVGSTFCSALVKRVLHLASANQTLAKDLLLAPCELQYELEKSPNWSRVHDWKPRLSGSRGKRSEERALKLARACKLSLEAIAGLEDRRPSLLQMVAIRRREIADLEELASDISLLSQVDNLSRAPSRWRSKLNMSAWNEIADRLRVQIAEHIPRLSPTQAFDKHVEELRAAMEGLEQSSETSNRDEISNVVRPLLELWEAMDLRVAKESVAEAVITVDHCGLSAPLVQKIRPMLEERLVAVKFLLSLKERYS
ncbi:hypothetical protein LUI11_32175 [Bradyrhizobium diazoefficiens]|nr:hypothetical protein [Bradyrhizobium diazoefficiens]MCD9813047.1 hypothetical protein [Bradyrhizobium diazoefficiens]MCD9831772.1 hypothetical protein [Bradyrhizobium diazoefficiens]MCD9849856.1 hypothetical protein [Bradyrhizobium diazoefficiens]MCD9887438.1 hypothetical protein [Bradyrhizobium diazoefficiens]MDC8022344.1 hypothetical protein [Bradyrhizobium diazoefficiens]